MSQVSIQANTWELTQLNERSHTALRNQLCNNPSMLAHICKTYQDTYLSENIPPESAPAITILRANESALHNLSPYHQSNLILNTIRAAYDSLTNTNSSLPELVQKCQDQPVFNATFLDGGLPAPYELMGMSFKHNILTRVPSKQIGYITLQSKSCTLGVADPENGNVSAWKIKANSVIERNRRIGKRVINAEVTLVVETPPFAGQLVL